MLLSHMATFEIGTSDFVCIGAQLRTGLHPVRTASWNTPSRCRTMSVSDRSSGGNRIYNGAVAWRPDGTRKGN
jgi:hypothetical protein